MKDDFYNYLPTVMFRGTPCMQYSTTIIDRIFIFIQLSVAGIEGKMPGWEGESLNYKDKGIKFLKQTMIF